MGVPKDIIFLLVREWLTTIYFYLSLEGENVYVHRSGVGTVQESILGPILYALFYTPLFDLAKTLLFEEWNCYLII